MASYRFCRTDDVALLVEAHNRCWRVNDGAPPMTIEAFRQAVRELDIWCSSCMVAHEGADSIAVLLAGKRATENLVYAVGVHPEHRRRGHGSHLLRSLSAKLAILGPPRLTAEVPTEWTEARTFLEACGYLAETEYVDWEQPAASDPAGEDIDAGTELIVQVDIDDLVGAGALDAVTPRCWQRELQSVIKRKQETSGLAIASDRIEAYVLFRDSPRQERREIVAFGCAEPRCSPMLGLLFRRCCRTDVPSVRISRVSAEEVSSARLESWGFRRTREYIGMATSAVPA